MLDCLRQGEASRKAVSPGVRFEALLRSRWKVCLFSSPRTHPHPHTQTHNQTPCPQPMCSFASAFPSAAAMQVSGGLGARASRLWWCRPNCTVCPAFVRAPWRANCSMHSDQPITHAMLLLQDGSVGGGGGGSSSSSSTFTTTYGFKTTQGFALPSANLDAKQQQQLQLQQQQQQQQQQRQQQGGGGGHKLPAREADAARSCSSLSTASASTALTAVAVPAARVPSTDNTLGWRGMLEASK